MHNNPCIELVEQMQIIAKDSEKIDSTSKWLGALDSECEKIKMDINKIKVQLAIIVAIASCIGGMIGSVFGKNLMPIINIVYTFIIDTITRIV